MPLAPEQVALPFIKSGWPPLSLHRADIYQDFIGLTARSVSGHFESPEIGARFSAQGPAFLSLRVCRALQPVRPLRAGLGGRPVLAIQPRLWVRAGPLLRAHPEGPAFLSLRLCRALQRVRPLRAGLGSRPVLAIQPRLWVRPYLAARKGLRRSNPSDSNFLGTAPPVPQFSKRR